MIKTISEMLESQAHSNGTIAGPDDQNPTYVQSYCIYQQTAGEDEVRFVAAYTDVLNAAGVVIPRYRTGEFREEDLSLCQFSLHALFRLNAARLAGMKFVIHSQLPAFTPVQLSGDAAPAKWSTFHPSRTLRTRPAVRERWNRPS